MYDPSGAGLYVVDRCLHCLNVFEWPVGISVLMWLDIGRINAFYVLAIVTLAHRDDEGVKEQFEQMRMLMLICGAWRKSTASFHRPNTTRIFSKITAADAVVAE